MELEISNSTTAKASGSKVEQGQWRGGINLVTELTRLE